MTKSETNPNHEIGKTPLNAVAGVSVFGNSFVIRHSSFVIRSTSAFTLMEVLLAVAVFSIVLVAINTVFYSGLRLRAGTVAALDQSVPVEQALNILRRDLKGTMP